MKLSIITINKNNVNGLKKTIESVVLQTSNDYEHIIIDGGSTDGSLELIENFKHKISYWVSEPDNGIYHAMNKGILVAKGEYCHFLNSGDWLVNKETVSLMLASLPNCNIIYGNMLKHFSNGRTLKIRELPVNSFLTFYTGTINHSSTYLKRSLFEKYGLYDENLQIVSDWKFYLIALLNNEAVCYQDIDVTCFEMNGISSTNHQLDRIERRRVLKELIPNAILADYDLYSKYIIQMKRIKRHKIVYWIVTFIERILFKKEKIITKIKSEHILY